jgi:DNA-binding NarL/FixJ family response regulator
MSVTDHEAALRAAQETVDAIRPQWDGALGERRRAVLHARADGLTIYRIAQILGVSQGAIRQILGLTSPGVQVRKPHPTTRSES